MHPTWIRIKCNAVHMLCSEMNAAIYMAELSNQFSVLESFDAKMLIVLCFHGEMNQWTRLLFQTVRITNRPMVLQLTEVKKLK